jgi:hypothetical protein
MHYFNSINPMKIKSILISLFLIAPALVSAQTPLATADFAGYTAGDLVGQNGWTQVGTTATVPLTVSNGAVTIPGGSIVNNQDAFLPFSETVVAPADGGTLTQVVVEATFVVNSTGASPSYFLAVRGGTFDNARIAARANAAGGYNLGIRVTGQSGFPFVYGTTTFAFGQTVTIRAVLSMVPDGTQNDIAELFTSTQGAPFVLEATSVYTTGSGTDPLDYNALVISQFGSATVNESGVSIRKVSAYIPAPATSIDGGSELVKAFNLEQNYPNPFNPSTVVGFQLSVAGQATLKVYDLLGREVAVLVNGTMAAGAHSVAFDASALTSGVYVYKLEAGGQSMTRRMTLIK